MRIYILLLFLQFFSCNDDKIVQDVCVECSGKLELSSFENKYFRFSGSSVKGNSVNALLFYLDTLSGNESIYLLCLASDYENLEAGKVIKASGSIYSPCTASSKENVLISDFDEIEVCPDNVPHIAGEFSLINTWIIDNLLYKDSIVYPPCESKLSEFEIIPNNSGSEFDHIMTGNAAINGFDGSFKLSNDTIIFSEEFLITLAVGTWAEVDFERIYFEGINANSKLIFNLSDNLLQLKNFEKNVTYNLYTK